MTTMKSVGGRPRKRKSSYRTTIRITPGMRARLKAIAEERGVSMNDVIMDVLSRFCRRNAGIGGEDE